MSSASPWMLVEPLPRAQPELHVARVDAVGVKLPERRLTTTQLMASTRHHTNIDLEHLTGIRERRVCSEGEDSLTLAVDAARDCLSRSRHQAQDLEMIVCASITRYVGGPSYRFEPPLSLSIKEALGAHAATNFDLSNACAGMLSGVFLLNDFVRRGVIRCGMVVSGEFISGLGENASRHIRSIYSRQLASLTLGDAGAAVIVERAADEKPGIALTAFTTLSEYSRLCLGLPEPHAPGAQMRTKARSIHKAAMKDAPPLLEEVLSEAGLRLDEIDWLIPHQTSKRAIEAGERELAAQLGARPKHVVINVEELGNTASTTHFAALHRCLTEGRFKRGDKVALLALASGLEVGVVVFVVDDLLETHGRAH
jgi:3-oxoacyl-[acyl-carrier-protein] synthase III